MLLLAVKRSRRATTQNKANAPSPERPRAPPIRWVQSVNAPGSRVAWSHSSVYRVLDLFARCSLTAPDGGCAGPETYDQADAPRIACFSAPLFSLNCHHKKNQRGRDAFGAENLASRPGDHARAKVPARSLASTRLSSCVRDHSEHTTRSAGSQLPQDRLRATVPCTQFVWAS